MRTRASAAVTAPTPQQWQTWWTALVARTTRELGRTAAGGGGPWAPGAHRDLTPAGLTRGTLEATVRAAGRGRAVELAYREHADEARQARVDVDGLEQARAATTSGTLAPLAWTGRVSLAAAGPDVRLDLTLPWGRLRLRARVVGDRLESELVVRGRGLWRPLAAVGLRLVRQPLRTELERATGRAAAAVGRVARDPDAAARADGGPVDQLGDVLGEVVGEVVDDRPLDAGAGGALQRALDLSWLRSPVTILRHLRRAPRDRS
ncbi:hypothetical protein [Aquipuribacter sp. MA13-6]|uniref:hypothetical protein n=1 Tax=unclassified Aquipuribacter TaxID=2635084 RepID=UPI003EED3544